MEILHDRKTAKSTNLRLTLFTIATSSILLIAALSISESASAQSNAPRNNNEEIERGTQGLLDEVIDASAEQPNKPRDNNEEIERDTQDLLSSISEYTAQQREAAVTLVNQSLVVIDRHIETMQARFEANMGGMSSEAKQMSRATLEELRERRAAVDEQLEQLASNTADAWDNVKNGFVDAYEQMYEAWEKAEMNLTESS